jgi:alkyldihydroxyacetonephosphate synthase
MRRWNGWGDDLVTFPLKKDAHRFLAERIGEGRPLQDATLEEAAARVPESRLPDHALVSMDPIDRVRHSRGQSLPDWLAMRSGHMGAYADGVAFPETEEEVKTLLSYAKNAGAIVIPYGGGTSVVGHINPTIQDKFILTINMGRINSILDLDEESRTATFGAGVAGPDVEAQLRAHGYTLGHFPQSFEYSTLGGWVATRSSGQQSLYYGRIEGMFRGGVLETPSGTLRVPSFPASAAGPDIREMILGSEGRLGILTRAKVRVRPVPGAEEFDIMFMPGWEEGVQAVRQAVQEGLPLSMCRLSTATETETQLALSGHKMMVGLLERYLAWRGAGEERCMLVMGATGDSRHCKRAGKEAVRFFRKAGGVHAGRGMGRKWAEKRFETPYLRNSLWEQGFCVDTLETATDWPHVGPMLGAVESALGEAAEKRDRRIMVFTHLSHIYSQGASIYTTYVFRAEETYEETLDLWKDLKGAASRAIVERGGTISHQHGVGEDHAPYLAAEKGEPGMRAIRGLLSSVDSEGMMNPGKLVS